MLRQRRIGSCWAWKRSARAGSVCSAKVRCTRKRRARNDRILVNYSLERSRTITACQVSGSGATGETRALSTFGLRVRVELESLVFDELRVRFSACAKLYVRQLVLMLDRNLSAR